jgi:hypothetical protein
LNIFHHHITDIGWNPLAIHWAATGQPSETWQEKSSRYPVDIQNVHWIPTDKMGECKVLKGGPINRYSCGNCTSIANYNEFDPDFLVQSLPSRDGHIWWEQ